MVVHSHRPAENSGKPRYFYYERVGTDHYYLRGVGPDGRPFTADDILPQVQLTPGSKLGLLIEHAEQADLVRAKSTTTAPKDKSR